MGACKLGPFLPPGPQHHTCVHTRPHSQTSHQAGPVCRLLVEPVVFGDPWLACALPVLSSVPPACHSRCSGPAGRTHPDSCFCNISLLALVKVGRAEALQGDRSESESLCLHLGWPGLVAFFTVSSSVRGGGGPIPPKVLWEAGALRRGTVPSNWGEMLLLSAPPQQWVGRELVSSWEPTSKCRVQLTRAEFRLQGKYFP